jgi:hypothetical protein
VCCHKTSARTRVCYPPGKNVIALPEILSVYKGVLLTLHSVVNKFSGKFV